jgi:cell cycle checkpoint protein
MAFLGKSLFSSYTYNPPTLEERTSQQSEDSDGVAPFSISLHALLETLQIFGLNDTAKPNSWNNRDDHRNDAFSAPVLGVSGICRLRYDAIGSPLVIMLEEPGISTACELVTYEPVFNSDIPFARDELAMKIIMGASYLSDAIAELSTSNPDRLSITATDKSLILSATGDLGSAIIQFHRDTKRKREPSASAASVGVMNDGNAAIPGVLETFAVPTGTFNQSYKFSHIVATKRALTSAVKVSIRGDMQGVLSLQFMIENLEGSGVSFVDYRFIPLIREDEEEDGDDDDDDDDEELGNGEGSGSL